MTTSVRQELLAIDGFQASKCLFSSWVWPLVDCPCSTDGPYTHIHADNSNYTLWVIKKLGCVITRGCHGVRTIGDYKD